MKKIDALRKRGEVFWPASVTDAIIDRKTKKPISGLLNKYNLSTLWPLGGIDGGQKYNIDFALEESSWRLGDNISPGSIIEFIGVDDKVESWQFHNSVPNIIKNIIWSEKFDSISDIENWKASNGSVEYIDNHLGHSGIIYRGGLEYTSFTRDLNFAINSEDYYIEFDSLLATGNYADSISQIALTLSPTDPQSTKYQGTSLFEINSKGFGSPVFSIKGTDLEIETNRKYWIHFKLHISSDKVEFIISSEQRRLASGQYNINYSSNIVRTLYFGLGKTGNVDCYSLVDNVQVYTLIPNTSNKVTASFDKTNWTKINLSDELDALQNSLDNSINEINERFEAETKDREGINKDLQEQIEVLRENSENEATRAKREEELINKKLNEEISLRNDQKTELDNSISNLESKEDKSISDLDTKINKRIDVEKEELTNTLESISTGLQQQVTSNTSRITAAEEIESTIRSDLSVERAERLAADKNIQTNIDNLSKTVSANKNTLESSISSETALRVDSDNRLDESIKMVDSNLRGETSRATQEEQAIRSEIQNKLSAFSVNELDLATDEDINTMFNTGG